MEIVILCSKCGSCLSGLWEAQGVYEIDPCPICLDRIRIVTRETIAKSIAGTED